MRTKIEGKKTKRLDQLEETTYFRFHCENDREKQTVYLIPKIVSTIDIALNDLRSDDEERLVIINVTENTIQLSTKSRPVIVLVQDHDATFVEAD